MQRDRLLSDCRLQTYRFCSLGPAGFSKTQNDTAGWEIQTFSIHCAPWWQLSRTAPQDRKSKKRFFTFSSKFSTAIWSWWALTSLSQLWRKPADSNIYDFSGSSACSRNYGRKNKCQGKGGHCRKHKHIFLYSKNWEALAHFQRNIWAWLFLSWKQNTLEQFKKLQKSRLLL